MGSFCGRQWLAGITIPSTPSTSSEGIWTLQSHPKHPQKATGALGFGDAGDDVVLQCLAYSSTGGSRVGPKHAPGKRSGIFGLFKLEPH